MNNAINSLCKEVVGLKALSKQIFDAKSDFVQGGVDFSLLELLSTKEHYGFWSLYRLLKC